jgi:protein ImuB
MKRVLCIRFPNWSIQCLRRELREQMPSATALALHTPFAPQTDSKAKPSDVDEDTRYVRAVFPSARGGPAIVAVSMDAWAQGVRPGMPLAEARSMAQPIVPKQDSRRRNQQPTRLIPPVEFREWQPLRDRVTLRSVAELTRRYAPVVGLDEVPLPDSLLLDITGCAPLFGGEAGLAESLLRDLRRAGWSCRIAIASSVAIGWALTHAEGTTRQGQPLSQSQSQSQSQPQPQHSVVGRADSRRSGHEAGSESITHAHDLPITIVPDGYERQELARLPVASSRLELSDLEILSHLGIRTLGQLLSLPREDLPSRFSESGVLRVQQLAGAVDEPIVPIPEPNPITALWSSDDPALGLNDIRFVLQILTGQIAEQLVRRRVACSRVSCHFRFPDRTQMEVTAGVVKPTQSAELLHEVLCLRVETQATLSAIESSAMEVKKAAAVTSTVLDSMPAGTYHEKESHPERTMEFLLSQPFHAVRMNVVVTSLPVARQKDLFSPEEHVVPQEELAALISRLSGRLGADAVRTLRTQPDPRPEFEVVSESVLGKDPALIRQAVLDEKLGKLTEPLQASDLLVGEQSIGLRIVSRPLRLLQVPIPIWTGERRRNFPTQLLVAGRTFQLRQFSAPERIQTAWWTDDPCHRDYYQVTTHAGSRIWLYRDLHTSQWFLHGFFD